MHRFGEDGMLGAVPRTRRRQLLFLLPGLLLVAALLVGGRLQRRAPEAAAPAAVAYDALLQGLSPLQRDVLAAEMRRVERNRERVSWMVGNIRWVKSRQLVGDVMACEMGPEGGIVLLVPAPQLTEIGGLEPCAPRCGPPDSRLLRRRACPPPRLSAWPELDASAIPSRSPPPPAGSPEFVRRAAAITQERESLRDHLAELSVILPDRITPTRIQAILDCTADATGVRVESVDVGTMRPLPELGPGRSLRQIPIRVSVVGPRVAMARFMGRLAHRWEIVSTESAVLIRHEADPNLVVLDADLLLYVLKPR